MTYLGNIKYCLPASLFNLVFVILGIIVPLAESLGCFKCESFNGSNPECDDPFDNISNFYEPDCKAIRPHRSGLFPATQCLKVKYYDPVENVHKLFRRCVVDNGGLSDATEIGRIDHCGMWSWSKEIVIDDRVVYGCITACSTDGCNSTSQNGSRRYHFITVVLTFINVFIDFLFIN